MKRLADEIAQGPLEMPDPARRGTIPVAFGGDDCRQLRDVARATGQSEAATIRENCDSDLRVLTIGFATGQPYIGVLVRGGAWDLPRMSELNPQVPAGALFVAVLEDAAMRWAARYSRSSDEQSQDYPRRRPRALIRSCCAGAQPT
ncbi:hypothetical protein BMG03_04635 [Thioclava nitratireducens]|uniref:Carboxyltransferase domain-containing protein n=1 Tax=Thioclava nitratireducens TaxID=1915078 RepID=A0ABN4XCJ5_9RHOB|nr:carboxyltransferase domain-containing protein [Thioclava nitratireducens]AQS47163.1 hypothetical protein BMG03_04635 [Thioclava nitratireducens]